MRYYNLIDFSVACFSRSVYLPKDKSWLPLADLRWSNVCRVPSIPRALLSYEMLLAKSARKFSVFDDTYSKF